MVYDPSWKHRAALVVAGLAGAGLVPAVVTGWFSPQAALGGAVALLALAGIVDIHRKVGRLQRSQNRFSPYLRELRDSQRALRRDHREVSAAVARAEENLTNSTKSVRQAVRESSRRIVRLQRSQPSEVEALLQLYRNFVPRAAMPSSGDWALNPTGLLSLTYFIETRQPKVVLELGSGTSSVWIAYHLEKFGGRLVSLEHDREYGHRTSFLAELHGLADIVEVRHAPLRPLQIDGDDFEWYDLDKLAGIDDIGLLLVDGPPGGTGKLARYPALPILEPRLSRIATVILDDIDRSDEGAILQRWSDEIAGLQREPGILGTQAILSYTRPGHISVGQPEDPSRDNT